MSPSAVPFVIAIASAFGAFMLVLGAVSVWSSPASKVDADPAPGTHPDDR